jgi:hypothetical protein
MSGQVGVTRATCYIISMTCVSEADLVGPSLAPVRSPGSTQIISTYYMTEIDDENTTRTVSDAVSSAFITRTNLIEST